MARDTTADRLVDNPARHRYEAYRGDTLAGFADYELIEGTLAMPHFESLPEFGGGGVATGLAAHALADARRRGLAVAPYCPFLRAYLRKHPEYLDLVPAERRARFGL